MKKTVLMLSAVLSIANAATISLSLVPSAQTIAPGAIASVDVIVAGLGLPPGVGAYDLDLAFDPAILVPVAIQFGPFLGDGSLFETIESFNFFPGTVDFAAVSLLPNASLYALQAGSFRLASIDFLALQPGVSTLEFTELRIDDEFALKYDVTGGGGTIAVVPEPAYAVLTALLIAVLAKRFYKARRHFAARMEMPSQRPVPRCSASRA